MNVKYIIRIGEKFLSLGNTKRKLMGSGMNNVEETQLTKNKRGRKSVVTRYRRTKDF